MYEPEISINRRHQYRLFCLDWLSVKRFHLRWNILYSISLSRLVQLLGVWIIFARYMVRI
jgi:hypothetical protein